MSDGVKGQTADVIVLGAGIVGVSAAYAIWKRGLSVILIDRREPGNETSYGSRFAAIFRNLAVVRCGHACLLHQFGRT